MDIKHLRNFVQVVEMGSISRAAVALSVAQPAISRQILNIEESLGGQLLHRNGRGVTTTSAGNVLYERAKVILEGLRRAELEIREITGKPSGKVIIGIPPTVSQLIVSPLIKRVRKNHPDISLQVIESFSGYIMEWLSTGRTDIAIFNDSPRTKHLRTERLLNEKLYLITASSKTLPADKISLEEVCKIPLILPSRSHGLRSLIDQIAGTANGSLNVTFEIDALPVIKELVEDGLGATILPYSSISREVKRGDLHALEIVDPSFERTLVFASTTQRPLSLATNTVIKELKGVMTDIAAQER